MGENQEALSQMGITLANHFDCVYYVDIVTGSYREYVHLNEQTRNDIPKSGDDYFADFRFHAPKFVYIDDLDMVMRAHDKSIMLEKLTKNNTFSMVFRLLLRGNIEHVRIIYIMCEDKKHIIFCLERIEEEIRQKKELEQDLQSAKRMARLDELTGIRNKNSFMEYTASINARISSGQPVQPFAIVMCDVNDLKHINDTRGHAFGDEAIQKASRMVCKIFHRSPVFRVGGDEFVAILVEDDYDEREGLLSKIKEESLANKKSRTGPVVACGMAEYDPERDKNIEDVCQWADAQMYLDKKELKSSHFIDGFNTMDIIDTPIPEERKHILDGMFGALLTVAGGGYIYLCDMRYDFSRWSLPLIVDFNLESEYMYHADRIWQNCIHPDDLEIYRKAVEDALCGKGLLNSVYYRARLANGTYVTLTTRTFILSDKDGVPEYFGGIILHK